MKKQRKKYGVIISLLVIAAVLSGVCIFHVKKEAGKKWYEKSSTICHAFGRTEDGESLTNSLEAFEYNYKLGQRVFEVDLAVTSDNVVVCRHDWTSDLGQAEAFGWTEELCEVPSLQMFLDVPIYGKYTPMTLLDVYEIMEKYKDIYVVLDSKYSDDVTTQYGRIVNTALEYGHEKVLNRIIPQIYYEDMYDEVNSIYPFEEYIYTLYYIGYSDEMEVGKFCEENSISVLVMPYTWFGSSVYEELKDYPVQIYVHTVNEMQDAYRMLDCGASGIYTDCILTKDLQR